MSNRENVQAEGLVSYPHLFTPQLNKLKSPPTEEYTLVLIFPGPPPPHVVREAEAAVAEKWPDVSKRPRALRSPFRKNEEKRDPTTGRLPEGYLEGGYWMTLRSTKRPGVVDRKVQPIVDPAEIYGGIYANVSMNCYAYSQAGNNGVSFGLRNVQKLKDGPELGGGSLPASKEFKPVAPEPGEEQHAPGPVGMSSLLG